MTDKPDDLQLDEEIDLEALGIPAAYNTEVFARQALEFYKTIRLCELNIAANNAVHNETEVSRLVIVKTGAMKGLVEIKKKYPAALERMKAVAEMEASR